MHHGFLTAIKLAKMVARAIRRDRDHLVRINADYFAGRFHETVFGKPVPNFECPLFLIKDLELWIKKTPDGEPPNCDGATLCPDIVLGFDLAPAYIPHDQGYPWIKAMAQHPAWKAAGWTEESIRALWDGVYGDIALYKANKLPWWHRIYARPVAQGTYGGVRIFGGIARWFYARTQIALLVVAVAAAAAGCSFAPPGVFSPSDDDPDYTVEPTPVHPFFDWLDGKRVDSTNDR